MSQETQWLVEPLDDETNDKIGTLLAAMQMADDVIIGLSVELQGRVTRINLYRTPHKFIQFVENSKKHQGLKIRIWRRKGERGKPEIWNFPKKSQHRRN